MSRIGSFSFCNYYFQLYPLSTKYQILRSIVSVLFCISGRRLRISVCKLLNTQYILNYNRLEFQLYLSFLFKRNKITIGWLLDSVLQVGSEHRNIEKPTQTDIGTRGSIHNPSPGAINFQIIKVPLDVLDCIATALSISSFRHFAWLIVVYNLPNSSKCFQEVVQFLEIYILYY